MKKLNRRDFLRGGALLAGASLVASLPGLGGSRASAEAGSSADRRIFREKFLLADRQPARPRSLGSVMAAVGESFLGAPYVAHPLETPGDERLVVNLRAFDCVSFVESTLAIARCIALAEMSFEEFQRQLQLIRYRSGIILHYPSRLHYFTDWIADNERKRVVRDITGEIGGVPFTRTINFMSTHRDRYRQLSDDATLRAIKTVEQRLSGTGHIYVPVAAVEEAQKFLRSGDIVAITTSVEGLDVIHTGLAVEREGTVKYLHAPLSRGSVRMSEGSLAEYLRGQKTHTGIIVARPQEPGTEHNQ